MPEALRAWLSFSLPENADPDAPIVSPRSLQARIRALHRRAGYTAHHPWQADVLRHSYATYYLKNGGSLNQLQLNMGHAGTSLLYNRYTNMIGITADMASQWWRITPETIFSDSATP